MVNLVGYVLRIMYHAREVPSISKCFGVLILAMNFMEWVSSLERVPCHSFKKWSIGIWDIKEPWPWVKESVIFLPIESKEMLCEEDNPMCLTNKIGPLFCFPIHFVCSTQNTTKLGQRTELNRRSLVCDDIEFCILNFTRHLSEHWAQDVSTCLHS